jgi:chemotaxis signal transduction protein
MPISAQESFVIFPLGGRRFALPSTDVVELTRTGFVQKFPLTTAGLTGVLMRRGDVLPVWDITRTLLGPGKETLKYWLVTRRNFAGEELTAIPVSGECQMMNMEMLPPPQGSAQHVRGVLPVENQWVEVLDLAQLIAPQNSGALGSAK